MERDRMDEALEQLRQAENSGSVPDFDGMWNAAAREAGRRKRIRQLSLFSVGVLSVCLVLGLIVLPGEKEEQVVAPEEWNRATQAVDDWLAMMGSEFFQELPSDPFFEIIIEENLN